MAQIEERIVELINLASIEVDTNKKVEYLYQIKELALNQNYNNNHNITTANPNTTTTATTAAVTPTTAVKAVNQQIDNQSIENNNQGLVIDTFFQDILAFQNERAPNVKKFVLTFIEAACKFDCRLCPKAILSLNLLLNDSNTEVIKRSIQTATHFYRALVQWIILVNSNLVKREADAAAAATGLGAGAAGINNNNTRPLSPQQQRLQANYPVAGVDNVDLIKVDGASMPTSQINISLSSKDDELSSDIEKTWLMWLQIKNFICNLLGITDNDGIRTHCIKFIETIILMQTPREKYTEASYDLNLIDPIITKSVKLSDEAILCAITGLPKAGILFNEDHKLELVDEAKNTFKHLVIFHGTSHISSVNLMAAMQSLVVLAKQRYRLFMGPVIQTMESLNNKLPPTLTESQVQSVKKFMKLQLTVMLKHPYSMDNFQEQLTKLLHAVGSKHSEINRVIYDYNNKHADSERMVNPATLDLQKRIKLEPGLKREANIGSQGSFAGSQVAAGGKAKQLDLNKLTQELDEKEKLKIVIESVKRILGDERKIHISPAQMEIKKKVLSTLANEFHDTECPKIIQDYIFDDLRNRHEICYAIIRKNYDVAAAKAAKRQINLSENQDLLKNYFDSFFSYLNRAMDLKDSKDKDIILPKLYALRDEYYTISNQDEDDK